MPGVKRTRRKETSTTIEGRENEMISLAMNQAEQMLREGRAPTQVVVHYLKLASPTNRLEREILEEQKELIKAKADAYRSQKRADELYEKAIEVMKIYSGQADAAEPNENEFEDFV